MKAKTSQTTKWRCRAECAADAELVKWALRGVAFDPREELVADDDDPEDCPSPDVGLSFYTERKVTLNMLRWIVVQLSDCHVAADTLAEFSAYTGRRSYLPSSDPAELPDHCTAPPKKVVKQVRDNLLTYAEWLESTRTRIRPSLMSLSDYLGD